MVRTRASSRLVAEGQTQNAPEESSYSALERLEQLEKKLRSKKYKPKRGNPPTNAPPPVTSVPTQASTSSALQQRRVPIIAPYLPGQINTIQQGAYSVHQSMNTFQNQFEAMQSQAEIDSQYIMWDSSKSQINNYPVRPDVKFKRLPFYDVMSDLVKPSTITHVNQDYRIHDFVYNLSPHEVNCLMSEPDVVHVQLRFCLLETSCEQEDIFPPNLTVKVNGKFCQLPMPVPTNKVIVEPRRPPGPVNITSLTKICPLSPNVLSVTWKNDFCRQYALCVSLVRKLTSSQLLTRLKNKGTKHPDFTRSLIKEKLREDLDCEIATTSLRVSLVCPLGKMRMICPCRPATCLHLQCFDASLFLQMNERKSTWICPVCDKPALFDVLVVDGYFKDVLNSSRLDKDCTEIQLHKDGSWSAHQKEISRETVLNETNPNIEIISDDIDIIPLSDGSDSSSGLPSLKRAASVVVPSSNVSTNADDIVDLISDESDDDLPLKRKTPNPPDLTDSVSIEVACDPTYITADSTTMNEGNESENSDAVVVSGVFNTRMRSTSIITLDSPSPPEPPGSPVVEVSLVPQAIVAPFHPEPDALPHETPNTEPIQAEIPPEPDK